MMSKSDEHVYEVPTFSDGGRLLKTSNRCMLITVMISTAIMVVCIIAATLIITLATGKQDAPLPASTDEYTALATKLDALTHKLSDNDGNRKVNLTAIVDEFQKSHTRLAELSESVAELKTSLSSQINNSQQAIMDQRYDPGKHVFHSKPGAEHYQMTLAQAKSHCESKGATLATIEQLQAAYEQGFQVCACGWLADGRQGYPMVYGRAQCGFVSGIIKCGRTLADAYCYK